LSREAFTLPTSHELAFALKLGEPGYPEQLAESPNPPELLYGIGDPGALARGLAVIGSRRATPYGRAAARMFAGWAASVGIVITSGGAVGCDQAAHRAALEVGGLTVVVLGCGADVDYPRGASSLLAKVRAGDCGCVVSEQPWGTPPLRWAFARRNRIIAALSQAVLVVEAALPSGTFSTADFADAANRDVLVVPGSIFSPESRGCNRLLRQGAIPITDVSELAAALGVEETMRQLTLDERDADRDTARIRAALLANPTRPDDVARELGLSIVQVARRIGALERQRVVARYPDGRYGPC
jgi:DNA processing protein